MEKFEIVRSCDHSVDLNHLAAKEFFFCTAVNTPNSFSENYQVNIFVTGLEAWNRLNRANVGNKAKLFTQSDIHTGKSPTNRRVTRSFQGYLVSSYRLQRFSWQCASKMY